MVEGGIFWGMTTTFAEKLDALPNIPTEIYQIEVSNIEGGNMSQIEQFLKNRNP